MQFPLPEVPSDERRALIFGCTCRSTRAGGDPPQVMAANALDASSAEAERLRARIEQLEAIARLNGETIRGMQRATAEARTIRKA